MPFTSIKTTGGWSTNAVQAAYALQFEWALRAGKVFEALVDYQPQQVATRGSSITVNVNQYYSSADVIAAATPLDEETDVTPQKLPQTNTVTFTPKEYGFANQSTIYLSNRGLIPVDPVIADAVGAHCVDTLDYLVQSAARAGTTVLRPPSRAATNTIAQNATDYAKATLVRQAVTTLRKNQARPRDGAGAYVAVAHPNVIHDLREESGSGSWRVPNEYGANQSSIWNGEFGMFEGARFISTPTLFRTTDNDGATSTNVFRTFFLGGQALGKAVVADATTVISPQTDKLRRWVGIGWKADLDYKVFRNEALVRLETASSLAP